MEICATGGCISNAHIFYPRFSTNTLQRVPALLLLLYFLVVGTSSSFMSTEYCCIEVKAATINNFNIGNGSADKVSD